MGEENDTNSENGSRRRTDDNDEVTTRDNWLNNWSSNHAHLNIPQQDTNRSGAQIKRQPERSTQENSNSKKDESTNGESIVA